MNMRSNNILSGMMLLSAALAFTGCAKDSSKSTNELEKDYLDKWASVNYPGYQMSGNGIYVLEETAGDGQAYNGEGFIIVNYTSSSLDGTISATTSEDITKQLGNYKSSSYYGPAVWVNTESSLPVGVRDMLMGMKKGGSKKALIPKWLNTYKIYETPQEYIKHKAKDASTGIYELSLVDFTNEYLKWQSDSLESFSRHQTNGIIDRSLFAPGEVIDTVGQGFGFYYKELKAPLDTTGFKKDTTIYINYIGRRLDGQIFDTTIKDSAKVHNIYNASKSYGPVKIYWGENYTDIKMGSDGSSSSLITGFQKLLWNMRPYGRSMAFFTTNYGYGTQSSGDQIPAYSPLMFEVEIVDKP